MNRAILGVFLTVLSVALAVDPLSATVALGAAAFTKVGKIFCATGLKECCDDKWIQNDIEGLQRDLNTRLHGQHLVVPIIVRAVQAHVADKNPRKPLVMSFHGWTGGGKSYVSQMIIENLYKKGERSNFVHKLYSELHFKHANRVDDYKDQLHSWIYHNVSSCDRSIFIFDEMDHMPEGMIDVLIPFLGHNTRVDGVDFRKNIFIFISNVGGDLITQTALRQHKEGKEREELTLHDFQKPLEMATFNLLSGLKGSDIIQKQLIDHFIPFLPLERRHVAKCVEDEFQRLEYLNFTEEQINRVLNELEWWPDEDKLYSKSGCTKVTHKTRLVHGLS